MAGRRRTSREPLRGWLTAFLAATLLATALPAARAQVGSTQPENEPSSSGSASPSTPGSALPTPSVSPMPSPATSRVGESPLETFYLHDDEGNLVPVLKAFTFKEWEELLRQKAAAEGADEAPRSHTLQELDLDVRIDPDRVTVSAKLKIKLHRAGWVRVPLRFDGMVLDGPPASPAERMPELEYDRAEGWVAYVQGVVDEVVELSLPLISPDATAFELRTWRATLPTATSSAARLSIAGGRWQVEEAPRAIVRDTAFEDGRTSFDLRLAGDASIAWSKPAESENAAAAFEAIETSRVAVETPTGAKCESSFLVQPLDGALKTVYVALPERAIFLPAVGAATVGAPVVTPATPEERARALPSGAGGTLLRVEAPMATMADFRFSIAYRIESSTRNRIVLERPRIARAVRQSGTVEVAASDEWNVDWTPRGSLERIDRSADDLDEPGGAAMFAYSQAPAPLEISIEPKTNQLIVEPIVRFDVGRRETKLEMRLACRFQGVAELSVRLPGWTVIEVGPPTLVDAERLNVTEVDPLRAPFNSDAAQEAGAAEIRIVATRRRPEGEKRLELSIPRIDDAVVNPALIAVQSADDVQVLEIAGESQGLTRDVWSVDPPLEPRQQAPLVYRDYGDVSDARIVLSAEPKSRQLSVDERTELTVRADGVSLEQRFAVQASYGMLDRFDLWIPVERLVDESAPTVTVNGDATMPVLIPDVDLTSEAPLVAPEGMKRFRVDVVPPRSGLTQIVVLWNEERSADERGDLSRVRLAQPILPPDAQRSVQPVVASSVTPVRLEMDAERWQATGDPETATEEIDRFIAADAANLTEIVYGASLRNAAPDAEPQAERVWLHTEATSAGLRQRFAVRVRHSGGTLRVQLPSTALPKSGVAAWNGVKLSAAEEGVFVVDLDEPRISRTPATDQADASPSSSESWGTLEVWYAESRPSTWIGLTSRLPQAGLDLGAAPFYWSVRLPPEETVLAIPAGMRSESSWRWAGWGFARDEAFAIDDLERWSGATAQPSPASQEVEAYSAFAAPATVRLTTVPRTWAYLAYGLCAFLVAGAWIYVPAVRRPWVALAAAIAATVLALWAPAWALPAAQVAAFGLALAVVAAAIDWWLNGRSARTPTARSISSKARGPAESGVPLGDKREPSTQSLQARAEIGA